MSVASLITHSIDSIGDMDMDKVMASDKVERKKVGKYEGKHAKMLTESILCHLKSYGIHAMPKKIKI